MRERFRSLIKQLHISQAKFAEEIGMTPQAFNNYMQERTKDLPSDCINAVKVKFNVNLIWLLTGEGEMFLTESDIQTRAAGNENWLRMGRLQNPQIKKLVDLILEVDEKDYSVVEELLRRFTKKK